MGNQQNYSSITDNEQQNKLFSQNRGLRVLHVYQDSVAEKSNILPFLDFIIGLTTIENENLDFETSEQFASAVKANKSSSINLQIYNIYTQSTRCIQIQLNDQQLGVLLRTESYQNSLHKILKVRSIRHDSPAQKAGLQPDEDYVLGTYSCEINDVYQLGLTFQNKHIDKVGLQLCVYNDSQKTIRYVTLIPQSNWIGVQLIGAEFGSGILNEMPTLQNIQLTQDQIYEKIKEIKYDGSNFKAPKVFDDNNQNEKIPSNEEIKMTQDNEMHEEKSQLLGSDKNLMMMQNNLSLMGQQELQQPIQQKNNSNQSQKSLQENKSQNQGQQQNSSDNINQQQHLQQQNQQHKKFENMQEKQQTVFTYFSEKINGHYTIKKEDLFPQLDIEGQQ